MKAYVYFINFLEYGDSCFFPVFSHKKYSDDEFRKLCVKVHKELSEEYFYTDSPVATGDMCRLIRDRLCKDYLFFKRDVKGYVVNDSSVVGYSFL